MLQARETSQAYIKALGMQREKLLNEETMVTSTYTKASQHMPLAK